MSHCASLVSVWLEAVTGVTKLLTDAAGAVGNGLSAEYNMQEQRTFYNSSKGGPHHAEQERERVRQTSTYATTVSDGTTPGDNQGPV